jgi:glycosyltransferase involved in cell wall biosynthesis
MSSISITVANADTTDLVKLILPRHYWRERNVGYCVWETEVLPDKFREADEPFSEIWTPSEFSAKAIRAIVSKEVVVVPHALRLERLAKAAPNRSRFGLPVDATIFGFFFDPLSVFERKNLVGLIRAFKLAFCGDDNVLLLIKSNSREKASLDYAWCKAKYRDEKIVFLEDTISTADVYDLMASLDSYVSLHRAEGFGLTCAEAMALGKPVIATGYSGNLQFMNSENSILVPSRVVETERQFGAYPAGSRWADPDLEAAAESMRSLLDREKREQLGAAAQRHVLKCLDPVEVAKIVGDRIGAGLAPGGGTLRSPKDTQRG